LSTSLTSAAAAVAVLPPWEAIDTVLLDMDGTLLDLHFDNHFWLEHLPQRYAEHHGISRAQADAELLPLFREHAGQLNWYCTDFWSRELNLSIRELKREVAHLIALRPDADSFLAAVRAARFDTASDSWSLSDADGPHRIRCYAAFCGDNADDA